MAILLRTAGKRGTSVHGVTFTWTPSPDPHEAANPTGCYRRSFDLPPDWCHTSKRLVLCLEGADSAAIVWLNGQWLGYTQDSRLPAEFDATVRNAQRMGHIPVTLPLDAAHPHPP